MKVFKSFSSVLGPLILIGMFLSFFFLIALAQAEETDDPFTALGQDKPVQQPQNQSRRLDFFTLGFMGVSIGSMLFASAVHWTYTQRKELEDTIHQLDGFLAHHCAVSFQVSGCGEYDRMIDRMRELGTGRDRRIREYEGEKNSLLKTISEIEDELVKLWG